MNIETLDFDSLKCLEMKEENNSADVKDEENLEIAEKHTETDNYLYYWIPCNWCS